MTTTVNTINGNEGNNRLTGTSRNDVINGNGGNDRLNGGSGDDTLNGGAGKDELNGGSGNDVLDGGSGSDELEGGSGNDRFIYTLGENNVKGTYDEYDGGSGSDTLELRFTRAEWMNEDNQKMLQSYLKWASKSGSGCKWDNDFTFRFGNARLEIEDIEKLVVKVDGAEIKDVGKKKNVDAVNDIPKSITEDETAVQSIYVLSNDSVDNLVKNLELVSSTTKGTLELVKPESTKDNANTWYFEYTPDSTVYQSLNTGEFREETFTYRVTDADGDHDTAEVKITITGINDAADITFEYSSSPELTEDINFRSLPNDTGALANFLTSSGYITIQDKDFGQSELLKINPYPDNLGKLNPYFNPDNKSKFSYTYEVENSKVQYLAKDKIKEEKFTIVSADGTTKNLIFTIKGVNDAAAIGGTTIGSVTEKGSSNGEGSPNATGSLTASDVDNDPNTFQVVTDQESTSKYGKYSITAAGEWTYLLNNDNEAVKALNSGSTELEDTFTIKSIDGTPQTITIKIKGANDAAVIGGTTSGSVTEKGSSNGEGSPKATGSLTASDVDNDPNTFQVVTDQESTSKYGTYSITATGKWIYELNNNNDKVNALNIGGTLTDSFKIYSADNTEQTIEITIKGANDAAIIGSPLKNQLMEDANNTPRLGQIFLDSRLSISDVDNKPFFISGKTPSQINGGYLLLARNGQYIYQVENSEIQYLSEGQELTEFFTVRAEDGTQKSISFTITGVNDEAVIGDPSNNQVTEDTGDIVDGFITLTGNITISDADKDEAIFQTDFTSLSTNIGTLDLNSDGSYTYKILNEKLQYLNTDVLSYDYFKIYAKDGTPMDIKFTLKGVDDDAENNAPVVIEIEHDEIKYAGSANVEELINLDHFTSDPAINTDIYYKAKYDFDHIRTGQFLVSDVDVGDQLTVSNESTNPEEKIGNLETEILQLKDLEGNPIGGKYVVNWTYTVKDSELDPLNKGVDEKSTKDQKFTVTINDGTESVNTEVVLHLFGRDEIEFVDGYNDENNVYVDPNGSSGASSTGGNDVMYFGDQGDFVPTQSDNNKVVYGEGGDEKFEIYDLNAVFFGGDGNDTAKIESTNSNALLFGGNGNDNFSYFFDDTTEGRKTYTWGGEESDLFHQYLSSPNKQTQDWIMDFDPRNPLDGGDAIRLDNIMNIYDFTDHPWNENYTKLKEHHADSNDKFLSEGATYYELIIINPDTEAEYSIFNLVGNNINLYDLFANENLIWFTV